MLVPLLPMRKSAKDDRARPGSNHYRFGQKKGFTGQIEFTKALVRFRSVRGAEHAIQDFVFRSFNDEGLVLDRLNMIALQWSSIPAAAVPQT